jgi:hypothetical protein
MAVPRPARTNTTPRPTLGARGAYRRWYAAAGSWAGFFRAVSLVAVARGVLVPRADAAETAAEDRDAQRVAALLADAGRVEGWLGRPEVLLLLDLPGPVGVSVAARLAPAGVRPVLLSLLWPEPAALVPAAALATALLAHAPRRWPAGPAQYAFLLGRERDASASAADLAARFDNRYTLGEVDLPSPARLARGGVGGVVACRDGAVPAAPDLDRYLDVLAGAGVPLRRLALGAQPDWA